MKVAALLPRRRLVAFAPAHPLAAGAIRRTLQAMQDARRVPARALLANGPRYWPVIIT
jgi:hypothetical protein